MLIVLTSLVGAASLLFAFGGTNAGALGGRFVLTSSFDFELGANIRLIKAKTKTTTIRVAVTTEGKDRGYDRSLLTVGGRLLSCDSLQLRLQGGSLARCLVALQRGSSGCFSGNSAHRYIAPCS